MTYHMIGHDGEAFVTSNLEWHKDARQVSKAEFERAREAFAIKALKKLLKPGSKVYTVLRHVSSSGMSRQIDLFVMVKNEPVSITHYVGHVTSYGRNAKTGALVIGGAGMDMGFAAVSSLGLAIWPKGTPKPHGTRNGKPDSNGGYALTQEWL